MSTRRDRLTECRFLENGTRHSRREIFLWYPTSVEATLEGGVLHMEMKKSESEQTRKIEVK